MKIKVKEGLDIGDGCPTFIIAEVGSNWSSLDDCLLSIHQAKCAGADAVKFQLFTYEELFGVEIADKENRLGFRDNHLPPPWLPVLKAEADRVGIQFMCSAFSPELIDLVDPYVSIHKLASAEMNHVRMLERLRKTGKPVVMSTGGSMPDDISRAVNCLGTTPLILLYCVASYPANEVDLDNINLLKSSFNVPIGFSDHTTNVFPIPRFAVEHGACVIEKHFTAIDSDTPDRPHSLNPDQFKRMVTSIRGGRPKVLGYLCEERDMITRHKRRLIATKDIGKGEEFFEGYNFGIYRSLKDDTHAFSPWLINEVNQKPVLRDIKAGDGIGPGDV